MPPRDPKADEKEAKRLTPLVLRAQKGESGALDELIRAVDQRLFRFCVYLCGNTQLARDLCQDSLVRVLEQLPTLREPERFLPWLFRCARNLHLDFVKGAAQKGHSGLDTLDESQSAVNPPDYEEMQKIRRALSLLEEADRSAVLLIDLEGHDYAQAAEIMGISESALRSRLHRARKEFLRIFSKE